MKGILLPGNSLKFNLEKVIVSKIAYKSLKTTKNSHFLRTDHRNVVHENFFRGLGDIIYTKNLFKSIRVINRTNSWAIWTRISEDIDHFKKRPATSLKNRINWKCWLLTRVGFLMYLSCAWPVSLWVLQSDITPQKSTNANLGAHVMVSSHVFMRI